MKSNSRLLERLDYVESTPVRVLDLGCGPGHAALAMRKRWKSAQVLALDLALPMLVGIKRDWLRPLSRVCADARALPLADASIDVLFSNLCMQWIDDMPGVARRIPARTANRWLSGDFHVRTGYLA